MLAQFQSLYPSGSLISELVQIDRGHYIVRTTVQIEGAIRATGMAAATTIEEAEDRARDRALMVLAMPTASSEPEKSAKERVVPVPTPTRDSVMGKVETSQSSVAAIPMESNISPIPAIQNSPSTDDLETPGITATQPHNLELQIPAPLETSTEGLSQQVEKQPVADIDMDVSGTNIKPFPQRSSRKSSETSTTQKTTANKKKKNEPVDQSDDIAKIGVEMQRLGWTMEQGRDHLIKTYNKRSRHLLKPEELKDFLQYLESQPTPMDMLSDIDPLAGF
ncbi:MAG: hypothetical protein QNJ51_23525 [Calothrix sp. MO_167.B12]|nr:hypothetical protein [Calothrix sp. MO_167.B12]